MRGGDPADVDREGWAAGGRLDGARDSFRSHGNVGKRTSVASTWVNRWKEGLTLPFLVDDDPSISAIAFCTPGSIIAPLPIGPTTPTNRSPSNPPPALALARGPRKDDRGSLASSFWSTS